MTRSVPQRRPYRLPSLLGLVLIAGLLLQPAAAAPNFPQLTGRVVDNAGMLEAAARQRLDTLLQGHENATSNQVVVVTLPDLDGYDIADYGYQLGRHWGIGQKGQDNGVLLIVARQERKVRIEVGYGLEGTLTDAISANIINAVMVPAFKKGQFSQGIEAGAAAIIQALGGQYTMKKAARSKTAAFPFILFFIIVIIIVNVIGGGRRRRGGRYYGGYYGGFGGRGGGGFGGGFGGGGGGFGGGGASGGW
jgi:uncharacterized protein